MMKISDERYSDLLDLAKAFKSYLEDDSRSERRRQACLASAKHVIAKEVALLEDILQS